ncbi:MAG: linalool dehydratase/isomerase domain-containing protein [Candidatus Thorarchaeota archaeon]|jgi:hypothetical protein
MSDSLSANRFVVPILVITIIFSGMTFSNLPGPATSTSVQIIDGVTFNFADYPSLNHEQIGVFNYFDSIITNQPYNSWDGWNSDGFFEWIRHYLSSFTTYVFALHADSTPGYRTSLYQELAHTLVKRMNTTIAEYGNESIEYWEWGRTSYPNYHFPDPANPDDLYVGGFRGPANIMWTGHYALSMALFERNFNTGEFDDEINWFVDDWNNSLTTDGYGNPKEGGIWGIGLIPCEPFIVFVHCNTIPIYTTELFDNLYDTSYMEGGMWDYGLDFINNEMQDDYDLFTSSYLVSPYLGSNESVDLYPRPSTRDGLPSLTGYGLSWALMFLEYTQENETINDYPTFIDAYSRDVSGEEMYMVGSYNNPGSFADTDTILASFFTMALANQRGDSRTVDRLRNFWLGPCNKVWSADGRAMHYEGGVESLMPFFRNVLTGQGTWGTFPVTIKDLATPRPSEFWDYPYISAADDNRIWVYQAQWDPDKSAFMLNVRVDQAATLTFSNFVDIPTAYLGGVPIAVLDATASDYMLTLQPGTYHLVIM